MQKHSRALWMTWDTKELPTKAATAPIKHCTHPCPYSYSQIVSIAEFSEAEAPKVIVWIIQKRLPTPKPSSVNFPGDPSIRRGHIFA